MNVIRYCVKNPGKDLNTPVMSHPSKEIMYIYELTLS